MSSRLTIGNWQRLAGYTYSIFRMDYRARSTDAPAAGVTAPDNRAARSWTLPSALARLTPESLVELLDLYLEDTGVLLRRLRDAYSCGDAACVVRAAHTLKGSSLMFQVASIVQACSAIEHLATKDALERTEPLIRDLEAGFVTVTADIRKCSAQRQLLPGEAG